MLCILILSEEEYYMLKLNNTHIVANKKYITENAYSESLKIYSKNGCRTSITKKNCNF